MPWSSEDRAQLEVTPGGSVGPAGRDQQIAVVWINVVVAVCPLTKRSLHRAEAQPGFLVGPHQPTRPTGAQDADAVEHENRLSVVEVGDGGVVAIAEWLGSNLRHRSGLA